jgi:hypothetical protein
MTKAEFAAELISLPSGLLAMVSDAGDGAIEIIE